MPPKSEFLTSVPVSWQCSEYLTPGEPDVVMVCAKAGKREMLINENTAVRSWMQLTPGEAKTIRGTIIHYADACAGRLGKGVLPVSTSVQDHMLRHGWRNLNLS
jgi:hypothetical protein